MMMNCFCGMVDRRKVFSLFSSRDQGLNLLGTSSALAECSCVAAITTTPQRHKMYHLSSYHDYSQSYGH